MHVGQQVDLAAARAIIGLAEHAIAVVVPHAVKCRVIMVAGDVEIDVALALPIHAAMRNHHLAFRIGIAAQQHVLRVPVGIGKNDEVADLGLLVESRHGGVNVFHRLGNHRETKVGRQPVAIGGEGWKQLFVGNDYIIVNFIRRRVIGQGRRVLDRAGKQPPVFSKAAKRQLAALAVIRPQRNSHS